MYFLAFLYNLIFKKKSKKDKIKKYVNIEMPIDREKLIKSAENFITSNYDDSINITEYKNGNIVLCKIFNSFLKHRENYVICIVFPDEEKKPKLFPIYQGVKLEKNKFIWISYDPEIENVKNFYDLYNVGITIEGNFLKLNELKIIAKSWLEIDGTIKIK